MRDPRHFLPTHEVLLEVEIICHVSLVFETFKDPLPGQSYG